MFNFECPNCGKKILAPDERIILKCSNCKLICYYEKGLKIFPVNKDTIDYINYRILIGDKNDK